MTSPKWTRTMTSTPLYAIIQKENEVRRPPSLRDPLTCVTDRVEGTRFCRSAEALGARMCPPPSHQACLNLETLERQRCPRSPIRTSRTQMLLFVEVQEAAGMLISSRCAHALCLPCLPCRSASFRHDHLHSFNV